LQQQVYELKTTALQRLISTNCWNLAAKKSGLSVDEFLRSEVDAKIGPPSDGELHGFYIAQPDRYQEPFENLRDCGRPRFSRCPGTARPQGISGKLARRAKIAILLEAPRVNVSVGDAPRLGAEERAKVTVIEFAITNVRFAAGAADAAPVEREIRRQGLFCLQGLSCGRFIRTRKARPKRHPARGNKVTFGTFMTRCSRLRT